MISRGVIETVVDKYTDQVYRCRNIRTERAPAEITSLLADESIQSVVVIHEGETMAVYIPWSDQNG